MEALIRWRKPSGEMLYPEDFLGLAEEAGLMPAIGEWVLETACNQARKWHEEGREMVVAINLTAAEFQRPDLAVVVRDAMRRAGLSPRFLEVEIAESIVMQDIDRSERALRGLADLSVGIVIDDFGTGYSSLAALGRLPVKALKVDRSLIRDCLEKDGAAILAAVFGIAAALDFTTVAEGVENDAQLEALRRLSCRRAQGHLFAAPTEAS
jgi:EAL domain-containing protein (putative c-di-GMP-specific phosphodiesterase class I)